MAKLLPKSIYDVPLRSADGQIDDLLGAYKGKVTLVFNCAAGCGNVPQHMILQELNESYRDEPDFNIVAVTVDDFTCHGYPEFSNGLVNYIEENGLTVTPGQVAQQYARDNYGATYSFSELTNGRYDKHRYDSSFVPGSVKEQDMHELWYLLTEAFEASIGDNGLPVHNEQLPWSDSFSEKPADDLKSFIPLTGNFDKFLVDRSGRRVRRYPNAFLLGERDEHANLYPGFEKEEICPGVPDWRPNHQERADNPDNNGPFPTPLQRKWIDVSLQTIRQEIDNFLADVIE